MFPQRGRLGAQGRNRSLASNQAGSMHLRGWNPKQNAGGPCSLFLCRVTRILIWVFFFLLFQQLPLWGHVLLIHRSPFQTLLRRLIRRKSIHWWVLRKKAFDLTAGQDSSDYHGPSWQQGGQAALALPRVVVEWGNHVVCITIFQLFRVERGERHQKW